MTLQVEIETRGNQYRIYLDAKHKPVKVSTLVLNRRVGWRYERKVWAAGEPMTVSADWALRAWRRRNAEMKKGAR